MWSQVLIPVIFRTLDVWSDPGSCSLLEEQAAGAAAERWAVPRRGRGLASKEPFAGDERRGRKLLQSEQLRAAASGGACVRAGGQAWSWGAHSRAPGPAGVASPSS